MASHEGNPTRTLQKTLGTLRETLRMPITLHHRQVMLGTLRETLGMPITLRHCQVTPGNAQPITPEALKLSSERYKQMPWLCLLLIVN